MTYKAPWDTMHHLAIVFRDVDNTSAVRFHTEDVVSVSSTGHAALGHGSFARGDRGVIIYLREGSVGVGKAHRRRSGGEDHAGPAARG